MSVERVEEFFEHLHERLVPYLTEHTGLSTETITRVLAAQARFWESRPDLLDALDECEDAEP